MEDHTCAYAPEEEVRLAVVMYGGVSLAIYINGITRELFRLVRATAPESPGGEGGRGAHLQALAPLDRVYRELGQLRGRASRAEPNAPIRRRFVVDILSGTSAGGINAVFLAKALATNGDVATLSRLWLEEGDLGRLLNDRGSLKDLQGLRLREPPESLLNSARMYRKLLEAMDQVDDGRSGRASDEEVVSRKESPFVEELDLWVTATDIAGSARPVRLADRVVQERRHRAVMHFKYASRRASGEYRNDFQADNNPLLAFAARCTSSFPFAFEPMSLREIDEPARSLARYREHPLSRHPRYLSCFHGTELRSGDTDAAAAERWFGDGGYLDNKPFSYATDTLWRRRADLPVDRKLLFIEPSPERLADSPVGAAAKPDAIDNALAALMKLPRYETIHEDIEVIRARNRAISRIKEVIRETREDAVQPLPLEPDETLDDWLDRYGAAYGVYHRLKVARVIDDLARLVTRVSGYDTGSDELAAVRLVVAHWMAQGYAERPEPDRGKDPTSLFLLRFDLGYRIRRVNHLRAKVNQLIADPDFRNMTRDRLPRDLARIPDLDDRIDAELKRIKSVAAEAYVGLRRRGRELQSRDASEEGTPAARVRRDLAGLNLSRRDLLDLLDLPPHARPARLEALLTEPRAGRLSAVARVISGEVREASRTSRKLVEAALATSDDLVAEAVRAPLRSAYRYFESYDSATFPILDTAALGETDEVDILRISPDDAGALVDNRRDPKLAGTALGNFGAFLRRLWRESDMMWGRLDAAECLVRALAPPEARERLLAEAQAAILREELSDPEREGLKAAFADLLRRTGAWDDPAGALDRVLEALPSEPRARRCRDIFRILLGDLDDRRLVELAHRYRVDRSYPPKPTARLVARTTTVVGRVLEGMQDSRRALKRPGGFLITVGRILWACVEAAVPRSLGSIAFRHLRNLAYLFTALLLIVGFLFVPELLRFAGRLVVIVLAAHAAVTALRRLMERGPAGGPSFFRRALPALVATLAALGGWKAYELASRTAVPLAGWIAAVRAWLTGG